jgi:UDP-N-acetylmuramate--alanine ligase
MSALARYFLSRGAHVGGYDRARTALTDALSAEGATVYFDDVLSSVDPAAEWVVYTPAIPSGSAILTYYRSSGVPLMKRSDVLQRITASTYNICIAGTHGKTTITTLTAHILRHSGYGCTAFLGGIAANYNTNFWSTRADVCVVEADEYDRSFHKLDPSVAVITAMDPDHLDIYGTAEAMEEAFIAFADRVRPGGWLLAKYGLARAADLAAVLDGGAAPRRHLTYSLTSTDADVHAVGLRPEDGAYVFDVALPGAVSPGAASPGAASAGAAGGGAAHGGAPHGAAVLEGVVLHMGGRHNVENTLAAVAVAHGLGIQPDAIRAAVAAFKGVHRRFEYVLRTPEVVLVDDYAHHPEELRALITGAKDLFPGRTSTVVFQPHLFSRTRDLAREFAASLDGADEVILLPIYPARELPMPGVTSALILDKMTNPRKRILSKEELLTWAADGKGGASAPRLIIMAGAGDIDALVAPVAERLKHG